MNWYKVKRVFIDDQGSNIEVVIPSQYLERYVGQEIADYIKKDLSFLEMTILVEYAETRIEKVEVS